MALKLLGTVIPDQRWFSCSPSSKSAVNECTFAASIVSATKADCFLGPKTSTPVFVKILWCVSF